MYKTQAIVFKKEDRLDSSRVFSVFAKDFGRLEITGRAIRKMAAKLRGGIELFAVSDIEFVQGKQSYTLTDAVLQAKMRHPSPEAFLITQKVCEVVDTFIKGQEPDEQIFHLLKETLERLCQTPVRQLMYYYFFWNFAALLGYAPESSTLAPDAAPLVALILGRDWDKLAAMDIPKAAQKSLQETSDAYYRYLLENTR